MNIQPVFTFFLTLAICIYAEEPSEIIVKFLSVKCQVFDPTWLKFNSCRVKSYSRNFTVLNLIIDLSKDLSEPLDVTIDILRKDSTKFSQIWPTIRSEYCSGFRNGFSGYTAFIVDTFRDSVPQLFQKCPFKSTLDYRNITVNNSRKYPMSQMVPSDVFRIKLKVHQSKIERFLIDLQIDIKSKLDWSRWGAYVH